MDAWFSPASTGPHTSHVHCIVVSIYCCENRYKDGVRDGAGTIYHIGGGESDAVFEDGELVLYTQYRYPCRFGTAIDGRCVLQDVARPPSRVTRVQAGGGGRVERAHHLPPPAAARLVRVTQGLRGCSTREGRGPVCQDPA